MIHLGDFPANHTAVCIPFDSFAAATGASSAASAFVAGDVQVYKDGGTTQRSSSSGIVASTSFDGQTGLQMITIDLSDNTDAGFYAAGHEYQVAVADITVDAQTVRFWAATFSIERANGVLAKLISGAAKVDVTKWLTGAIPAVNVTGVPLVDLKYTLGTISPATAGSVRADAVTGSTAQTGDAFARIGAAGAGLTALGDTRIANLDAAVSTRLATSGYTAQTGDSFARIGAAGAGLTALGDTRIANLDAAVSSRSTYAGGPVASVTGAVGSVTGMTASDVAAIKAKTDNLPAAPANETLVIAATDAIFARLGAPAGASVSADIAAAKSDTGAIKTKTDSLTFTVAASLDVNVLRVNGILLQGVGTVVSPWKPA